MTPFFCLVTTMMVVAPWIVISVIVVLIVATVGGYLILKKSGRRVSSQFQGAPKGKVAEKECACPPGFYWTDTESNFNGVYEHCRRRRRHNGALMTDTTGCNMLKADYTMPGTVIPKSQW